MTEAPAGTSIPAIVKALSTAYQRQGYHSVAVPASLLLTAVASRDALETALGALLDDGSVVPMGAGGLALAPGARIALLTRAVLVQWLDKVSRDQSPKAELYRGGIATELGDLVAWASTSVAALPHDLIQRAAELAGVLVTSDLDPRAMEIVATHGGTPRTRLAALAALPPRSLPIDRLRDHLRHTVSSAHPGR